MTLSATRRHRSTWGAIGGTLASSVVLMLGSAPPAHATPATAVRLADAQIFEGDSGQQTVVIPLSLSAPLATDLVLKYTTIDQTATSPADYKAKTGSLKIPAGHTTGNISVVVYGDTTYESSDRFVVKITSSNQPGVDLRKDWSDVDIRDDDTDPTKQINIADSYVVEGNAGTYSARSVVTLSEPAATDIKVSYTTNDGTATAPNDYLPKTGHIVIRAGKTTGTIVTSVVGDTVAEPRILTFPPPPFGESYLVEITNVSDASYELRSSASLVTISDDEPRADGLLASNLGAAPGATPGSVYLTFTPPTGPDPELPIPPGVGISIAGYLPSYSTDNGQTWTDLPSGYVLAPTTSTTIDGLPTGKNVRVALRTAYSFFNSMTGESGTFPYERSEPSNAVDLFVGAPTNVTATRSPYDNTVDLTWTPPAASWPVTGYRVETSNNNGATWDYAGFNSAPGISVTVSGGTTLFRVIATSGVSIEGPASAPASFTAVVGKPTMVKAVKSATPGMVDLTWVNGPSTWFPTMNNVEYSTDGGVTWFSAFDVPPTGSATIGPLPSGTYRFRMTASNGSGMSLPSAKTAAITL